GYAERPEVRAFVRELVERHGFVERELLAVFARAQRSESVLQAVQAPAGRRPWEEYRATFLTERRIAEGVAFWNANRKALERAERQYGVPPEYVLAILGVETFYGRNTGRWRVVDALTTLAFDHPPRAPYFRDQLEQYLLLGRDGGQKRARRTDPGRSATARQGSAGRGACGARRARDAGAAERVPHRLQELLRHHAVQPQRVLRRRGQRSCQGAARSSERGQIAHRIDGSRSLADL